MHPDAQEGLYQFNQRKFYGAHEYFETAWRETKGESREFYRALLQMCGGFFRLTQGSSEAAKKFFTHSLHWLGFFPEPYQNVDTTKLKEELKNIIHAIDGDTPPSNILDNFFAKFHNIFEEKSR